MDGPRPVLIHAQAVPDVGRALLLSRSSAGTAGTSSFASRLGLTRISDTVFDGVQGGLLAPQASPVLTSAMALSGGTRAAVSSLGSRASDEDVFELLGFTRYRTGSTRLRTGLRGSMRLQQGGIRDVRCGLRVEIGYSPELRAVIPADVVLGDASGSIADDDVLGGGSGSGGSTESDRDSVRAGDLPPLVRRFRIVCDECGAGPSAAANSITPAGGRVLAEVDVPLGLAAQVRLHPLPLIPTLELRLEVAKWTA